MQKCRVIHFFPRLRAPGQGDERLVVRSRRVGGEVEVSLSRETREHHRVRPDTYTAIELLAIKRFDHVSSAGYVAYGNALADAARYAARGELGYTVDTVADGAVVRVSLVARLLMENGNVKTDVSHEHAFADPDSNMALVQASEKAAELRVLAQQLNDNWTSTHQARLLEIQAGYDQADADAAAARGLERIVDAADQ